MKIIVWYRNDLRVHDHEALWQAAEKTAQVVPVYVFDPRTLADYQLGFLKTGPLRQQFLRESVANLRANLQKIGSNLLVRVGFPEDIIPELAQELGAAAVYASEEITHEEMAVETRLEERLKAGGRELRVFWEATLVHVDDLPMKVRDLPDVFTQYKNKVERFARIQPTFLTPQNLKFAENTALGDLPAAVPLPPGGQPAFRGGEDEARARLHDYFWTKDLLRTYKETRNGMLGLDYSSKFSPWLANGCLSPRYIYEEVRRYEAERTQNESTYWLIFELYWRDYFRFVGLKFGNRIFQRRGLKGADPAAGGRASQPAKNARSKGAEAVFEKWRLGETGVPLIDANMRELLATGFMSNRGRQNVASFLVQDLHLDWRWGAAWFESQGLDYDVCSNWGNWLYVAGVGNDPRENRYFNILKQATNYDPQGEYVRHWLPELAQVPANRIHSVGLLANDEQKRFGVRLGVDYPNPLVDVRQWARRE